MSLKSGGKEISDIFYVSLMKSPTQLAREKLSFVKPSTFEMHALSPPIPNG